MIVRNSNMAANAKELEKILKAVANKRRIEMLRLIRTKREAAVGDIAEELRLSFKATSKHLRVLYSAGFIEREQRGVQVMYRISNDIHETVRKVLALL
jgi:ArsR family transcriptional regulator, arsenate/arsenite/antimonite-responsive transcriptional repressor